MIIKFSCLLSASYLLITKRNPKSVGGKVEKEGRFFACTANIRESNIYKSLVPEPLLLLTQQSPSPWFGVNFLGEQAFGRCFQAVMLAKEWVFSVVQIIYMKPQQLASHCRWMVKIPEKRDGKISSLIYLEPPVIPLWIPPSPFFSWELTGLMALRHL